MSLLTTMAKEMEPRQYASSTVTAVSIVGSILLGRAPIIQQAMDHIFIRDFRLQTLIGFHRRERVVPQTIRLDLEIGVANTAVFQSDKVSDCMDYDKMTARIKEV